MVSYVKKMNYFKLNGNTLQCPRDLRPEKFSEQLYFY